MEGDELGALDVFEGAAIYTRVASELVVGMTQS